MSKKHPLVLIGDELSATLKPLRFREPVTHVYNPLEYAREPHVDYSSRFGNGPKEAVFVGMNPGPWGMAQTGIPFGEIAHVRDWLKVTGAISKPPVENPKRPVTGFECARSEVSGRRLWGWAKERFDTPEAFFDRFFVFNYCPLIFMEAGGKNRVPEKLPKEEREPLFAACDEAFRKTIEVLDPEWVIGVGAFARKCSERVLSGVDVKIGQVLHPSPASPAANKGWMAQAEKQLGDLGIPILE